MAYARLPAEFTYLHRAFLIVALWLIVARAGMGVAGATLMLSTLSMIRNVFHEPAQRRFAIGVWMMCFSVGVALGPLVGGAMLERFWWGSVFLLAVPSCSSCWSQGRGCCRNRAIRPRRRSTP